MTERVFLLSPLAPMANLGMVFFRGKDAAEPLTFARGINLDELPDGVIQALVEAMPRRWFPPSFAPIPPPRGRFSETANDATAFGSLRRRRGALSMVGMAPDEGTFAGEHAWARNLYPAVRPYTPGAGADLDFETDTEPARVRASYGEGKWPAAGRAEGTMGPGQRVPVERDHRPRAGRGSPPGAVRHPGEGSDRADR